MFRNIMLVCALALLPASAWAQGAVTTKAWGPRLGISSGPDQFVIGGQMVVGEVAPSLSFDPSVELGFGDNRTRFGVNFDFHYHFATHTTWKPYAGAGGTLDIVHFDESDRDNETNAGLGLIVGASAPTRSGNTFFSELNIGLSSIPDLRLMVGWNFKR